MTTAKTPSYPPLDESVAVDTCIVGAGMSGLSTAYMLAQEGVDVLVVDDGPIGGGESERTTAHLASALDDRFTHLEKLFGKEGSKLAAQSHSAAIDTIEKIVHEEGIECGFKRVDGYLFHPPNEKPIDLKQEMDAASRAGLHVSMEEQAPIPSFDTGPCLRFRNQGQFHITQYLQGLAKACTKKGARICTGTHIADVKTKDQSITLKTSDRKTIKAKHLIIATNAPIYDNVAIYSRQSPYRTFAIGLQIPEGSVPMALYWDTLDSYHYVRVADVVHNGFDVLVVGGEDHKTGQADDAGLRFARLEKWARARFPMAEDLVYRWSGQVMEPIDSLAYIGRKPMEKAPVFIVTGDSGHGMTHGTIAGLLLRDLILERKNPWEDLYSPSRISLKSAGEFMKENANVAAQFKDMVTGSDVDGTGEIAPGTGRIIRKGLKKMAVYRDDDGRVHSMSAVCPHKGCLVRWNSFEKSWDCPCHGSRYSPNGQVLNGPTIADLKRLR